MVKIKILVIEDNPFMSKLLESRLKANDYEVIVAFDGKSALEKVQVVKPDLILLDVNMPGMDGFQVASKLKKNDRTKAIPLIFVTARGDKRDIIEGIAIGAVTYIIKPFTPEHLLNEIKQALQKK